MDVREYCREKNRINEEVYARDLTGISNIHVEFVEGKNSYTDGKQIFINPGLYDVYKRKDVLSKVESKMGLDPVFSSDEKNALQLMSRLENMKCCLRVKYGQFPEPYKDEPLNLIEVEVLKFIYEIVEDAYIDTASRAFHPTLAGYRNFARYISLFAGDNTEQYLVNNFKYIYLCDKELADYLVYMRKLILFPDLTGEPDEDIVQYVEKTKQLFFSGSMCTKTEVRYTYVLGIFDIIKDLLPEIPESPSEGRSTFKKIKFTREEEEKEVDGNLVKFKKLEQESDDVADGSRLHDKDPDDFTDMDYLFMEDDTEDPAESLKIPYGDDESDFGDEDDDELAQLVDYRILPESRITARHKGVRIIVRKSGASERDKLEYNAIRKRYSGLIMNYRNKIEELLSVPTEQIEYKHLIGSDIDSKRLCDIKGRFWIKKNREIVRPELSILFMVDNSGSMEGIRIERVREAMVIINEVLRKKEIEYAVVGYMANFRSKEVMHNLAIDYKHVDKDKYNIMTLRSGEDNRDGASLMWADEYLRKNSTSDNRIIITITDGLPCHAVDDYFPPASSRDTKNIVKNIEKNGTKVIAIAIEEGGFPCYDLLEDLYSEVIECNHLERLPKQLFELISKQLKEAM